MKFFNSPRPVGEMVFGAIIALAAGVIGPGASARQFGLLHGITPWIVVLILALGGVVLFVQGLGTYMLRRSRD